jgi:sugar (pentulose or hexulose) kinase
MSDLVLVVDAGTGSIRACVFSVKEARTLGVATRPSQIRHPALHRAEFTPEAWWKTMLSAVREVVDTVGRPAGDYLGITATSLRQGFVLLDAAGRPLGPGVLNYDRRGAGYTYVVDAVCGAEELYDVTGHWSAPELTLPKLLWFRSERPAVWDRIGTMLFIHDWLLHRLCGERGTNATMVCSGQMADVRRRGWSEGLMHQLGLPTGILPPVYEAGHVLGGLQEDVACATGLLPGTPVHVGGGDTQFASLGVGAIRPGDVVIVGGSTAPLMLTTDVPVVDPQRYAWVSTHLLPDRWTAEMNAGHTGMVYEWLGRLLREANAEADAEDASAVPYDTLNAAASAAPIGCDGLLAVAANPRWAVDTWRDKAPYVFFNFDVSHSLGHLARSVLEGVCYGVRGNLEHLERVAPHPFDRILFTGGCASVPLWAQMMADVLGRAIEVPDVPEPAAVAGAQLVLMGHQDGGHLAVPDTTRYKADPARAMAYEPHYRAYRHVFDNMQEYFGSEGGNS